MVKIEASILSADLTRLGEQVREAEEGGADAIQIDIMDGCFVPNITFGPNVVKAIRPLVRCPLTVHGMIVEPERHLAAFAEAGANCIIVHQETCPHLHRTLALIRELHVQAGVALNPGTPLAAIEEVLDCLDVVQVMTVNPGWGGQEFLASQLQKIRRLRGELERRGLNVAIAVDGGIDCTTAPRVVQAGATILVAGSSVYNHRASVADNVARLRRSCIPVRSV
ncbi:MAG: ribulose-phosphate 3-epimerase [bacterium]|jgi:ribulose-phosphate 3-epimerase|nr:ribulose-phosphate 3-epimerase [candidate division KSB1 bacterium]MDH7559764.1 ribulose-phosphate 3-epimerase [bacterium]